MEDVIAREFRAAGRQPPMFDWGIAGATGGDRLYAIAPSNVAVFDLTEESLRGQASAVEERVREWVREHLLTDDPSGPMWK